jgi:outer membrane protein OmpA-like peptidoglycan-associated protein
VALGGRFWLLGEAGSTFALSGELTARFPTARMAASDQVYSGDRIGSYEPAFIAELRLGGLDFSVRPGLRLRQQHTVSNLKLGSEFVYGAAIRLTLTDGVYAHFELFGAAMLTKFGDREQTPLEMLSGFKFALSDWHVGVAAEPGLSHGFGAPDLRALLALSYSPTEEAAVAEPIAPGDMDGDGLLDPDDRCPERPEDFDDFQDTDGCPDPDNDHDRVMDVDDQCVMEPEDRDRFEDTDGCPDPDNDQDGILDDADQCPLQPEDMDGFEDADGCPDPDNDHDTVLDVNDDCPLVPGSPQARGCVKEVLVEIEGSQIMVLERVEFANNKDVILERSMAIMEAVERTLSANTQLTLVRIEGHTDDVGRDRKNMTLSQRRARSVARWLIDHGIDASRLEAYGCGENRPLEPNNDAEARQTNRRVEFHIVRPSTSQPRSTGGCRPMSIEEGRRRRR